jgi:hypothetical protein
MTTQQLPKWARAAEVALDDTVSCVKNESKLRKAASMH